jgi:serine/threonine-protein kinase
MRVALDVIAGPRKGQSFVFDRHDTFVVGRSRYVHCSMPEDSALSRDHFMIEMAPPLCQVRDLGSTNGTFVNDERIERARISAGDRITAGQSIFRVRLESSADSSISAGLHGTPNSSEAGLSPTASSPSLPRIVCSVCNQVAPPNLSYLSITDSGTGTDLLDSIHWLCDHCRDEAAMTPQPVPHFTMLRELGRGAMGVVYLAQSNTDQRKVALKLIAPETAAARSAIDRFLREMAVVSQLKHPNIVEFYEQGTTQGRFWFAMEYIDGTNLEALARQQPGTYPLHQACRMAYQVLKGLEHAHAHGFVHRDIKPENILIGKGPQGLTAKISDFGLAKSFRSLGLSGLTFSGEMRGTIPFMPPEQVLDFKKVLPAGDLYATAATLYYLITNQFIYDQAEGTDPIRLLLEEPPVPIEARRPDVPRALSQVLQRCLARDPAERYPDARSLRQAIRPFC